MKLKIGQLLEEALDNHKQQHPGKGNFAIHTMTNKKAGAKCSECKTNIGVAV